MKGVKARTVYPLVKQMIRFKRCAGQRSGSYCINRYSMVVFPAMTIHSISSGKIPLAFAKPCQRLVNSPGYHLPQRFAFAP